MLKAKMQYFLKEGRRFLDNTNNNGLQAIMETSNIKIIDNNSIEKDY